jgi:hypothetical protein
MRQLSRTHAQRSQRPIRSRGRADRTVSQPLVLNLCGHPDADVRDPTKLRRAVARTVARAQACSVRDRVLPGLRCCQYPGLELGIIHNREPGSVAATRLLTGDQLHPGVTPGPHLEHMVGTGMQGQVTVRHPRPIQFHGTLIDLAVGLGGTASQPCGLQEIGHP